MSATVQRGGDVPVRFGSAIIGVLALQGCNGCNGKPPDDLPDDSGDSAEDTGDSGVIDTAPEPPCDVPEIEPNDAFDAGTPLPLEREGCGTFSEGIDLDRWDVEFDQTAWLGILIDAHAIGSSADPTLTLQSDGGQVAQVGALTFGDDVRLIFPSLPDTYRLLLTDQNATGGEDYFYDILATHTKAPLPWNVEESEPNETRATGMAVAHGDVVFGMLEDSGDDDWYSVDIPAGPHSVSVDVDAYSFGSAADLRIVLYDELGEQLGDFYSGETGVDPDPWFDELATGNEVWSFRVRDQADRSGRAYWYVLNVTVEAK